MPKTFDELLAQLNPDEANLIKTHITGLEGAKDKVIADLQTDITAKNTKIGELTADLEKHNKPDTEEEFLKSLPTAAAELIKSLKKANEDMLVEKATALANERFQLVKAIPCEEKELKEVLKAASPATFEILKKAAAAISNSTLTQKGKEEPTGSFSDAYGSLEKSAKALQANDATLTYEQAFTKACTENPELYSKYVKEVK